MTDSVTCHSLIAIYIISASTLRIIFRLNNVYFDTQILGDVYKLLI